MEAINRILPTSRLQFLPQPSWSHAWYPERLSRTVRRTVGEAQLSPKCSVAVTVLLSWAQHEGAEVICLGSFWKRKKKKPCHLPPTPQFMLILRVLPHFTSSYQALLTAQGQTHQLLQESYKPIFPALTSMHLHFQWLVSQLHAANCI